MSPLSATLAAIRRPTALKEAGTSARAFCGCCAFLKQYPVSIGSAGSRLGRLLTRSLAGFDSSTRLKRAIDVAGALAGLAIFAPVMLATAVFIRFEFGTPLLFRQQRPGKDGALFTVYKFRTMRDGAHLPDAARLTPAGVLLRSLSVDELPQFWNVLRGDMSLVGPRPLLPEYLPRYTRAQRRRLDVKPGITGWSQVRGRNTLSWDEKFALDTWYVDHAANSLDLLIMLKTVATVLSRQGINQPGAATVARFCPSTCEVGDQA